LVALRFATVYPLVTTRALARPFTYELTNGAAKGAVVSVLLGRSRRRGVVVELVDTAPEGVEPVPIDSVLDELPPVLVDLALWVADYYGSTPGRALELIAPVKRKRRKEQAPPGERQALTDEAEPPELTSEQHAALARITSSLDAGGGHFLLYGETGSGKTEVYLRACAEALERGRSAIVLVPEIALTPQTLGRFQARFGDSVAVLHSGRADAERRAERERWRAGRARVAVRARHCRACGTTLRCPLCDVALVLHGDERLRCHHCGHEEAVPEACPTCRSVEIARIGAGTQRLEHALATQIPELELIRLDADTTEKPETLAAALRRFAEADRAVLL